MSQEDFGIWNLDFGLNRLRIADLGSKKQSAKGIAQSVARIV
jgi:hypothetical protein